MYWPQLKTEGNTSDMTTTEEEQAYTRQLEELRQEAFEREKLAQQQQEAWLDSDEYREARGAWIKSAEFSTVPFEQSKYFRNARAAYKKRVQNSPI
jgi:hypothetical protein